MPRDARIGRGRDAAGAAAVSEEALVVHNMCMFSERFQILISPEQRSRLEQESKARGVSVAALVREAIDSKFHIVSREEKIRAAEEIAAMGRRPGTRKHLTVEEMDAIIDEEMMKDIDAGLLRPPKP